jgi:hypothetical protein
MFAMLRRPSARTAGSGHDRLPIRARIAGILLVLPLLTGLSCESLPGSQAQREQAARKSRLQAEEVQVDLMAFADSYAAIMGSALDLVAEMHPDARRELLETQLRHVRNAIIIASSQSPVGGLLDMVVMVTLQRQLVEEYWVPEHWGDYGVPILEALQRLEIEIESIAERRLTSEQYQALQELIPQIRERYRDETVVSSIRATDFAEERRATVANLEGGGSLLRLFHLDPLAGLSPAAQELAQSRLLAERFFFWAKRMPELMAWQVELVVMDTFAEPQVEQALAATTALTEASQRIATVAEELSTWLPEERQAALDQLFTQLTAEREAAIAQLAETLEHERETALADVFDGIRKEREAVQRVLEAEDPVLRGLLEELRATIEAGTTLSTSLTETLNATDRMRQGFTPSQPRERNPDARPFDINDYRTTAESLTVTVGELNQLLGGLNELLASPDWNDRTSQLGAATDRAQAGFAALIDRSFVRGLLLVVALLVAAVLYRVIAVRFITPRP